MSARVFEGCGFRAIATTSAGVAWAMGRPDGEGLGRGEMAGAVARVAGSVSVPVTADAEAGYGPSPEDAAETARAMIRAGAVGVNLEDAADPTPPGPGGSRGWVGSPLADLDAQLEKVRAVVAAGGELGVPLVVNARTDTYWREVGEAGWRFAETVRRANAFLGAGADCVFVPGVKDPGTIAALVREIPGPLNVLAGAGSPTVRELGGLGVGRVSVGSGPARAVMGLMRGIGLELLRGGTYSEMGHAALPYPDADALFKG
jgi:2-methylisocitrate lyase-like PEP mutase family enzyme